MRARHEGVETGRSVWLTLFLNFMWLTSVLFSLSGWCFVTWGSGKLHIFPHSIFTTKVLSYQISKNWKLSEWGIKGKDLHLYELPERRQKLLACTFYISLWLIGIWETFWKKKWVYNIPIGFDHKAFLFHKAFFFWLPHGIWSPQARDQMGATVLTYTTAAAMPDCLTHCEAPGIETASQCYRDAADPIVPQW